MRLKKLELGPVSTRFIREVPTRLETSSEVELDVDVARPRVQLGVKIGKRAVSPISPLISRGVDRGHVDICARVCATDLPFSVLDIAFAFRAPAEDL